MFWEILALVVFVLFLAYFLWTALGEKRKVEFKDFLPGPNSLPNTSTITQFTRIQTWREKYGDLIGFRFGSANVIILHGYNLIKEAFQDPKFNSRPIFKQNELIYDSAKSRGLLLSEGKLWSEQRKFTMKNLRDLGVGKETLENMINQELADLVIYLKQTLDKPINLTNQLSLVVLNSLWHLIAGERFALDDPNLKNFQENLFQLSEAIAAETFGNLNCVEPSSWINRLMSTFSGKNNLENSIAVSRSLIQTQIVQHKKSFQDENCRDFIDLYIREINDTIDKNSSFYKDVGDENMAETILNILTGGIEPTSSVLNWTLFFLSKSPSVQKKLQEEIDMVIGHFHPPRLNDRLKMPYTEAVILETLRLSSVVSFPFGLPHATTDTVTFHNFILPKGAVVIGNLHDLHHNEKIWKNPSCFLPERFILPTKHEINHEHPPIASFSTGKRTCPGETFAKDVVFLFLTSIFQRFHVLPTNTSSSGLTTFQAFERRPTTLRNFKIVFEDRLEFLDRAFLDEHAEAEQTK